LNLELPFFGFIDICRGQWYSNCWAWKWTTGYQIWHWAPLHLKRQKRKRMSWTSLNGYGRISEVWNCCLSAVVTTIWRTRNGDRAWRGYNKYRNRFCGSIGAVTNNLLNPHPSLWWFAMMMLESDICFWSLGVVLECQYCYNSRCPNYLPRNLNRRPLLNVWA